VSPQPARWDPTTRRDAIDVARVLALALVVLGHLSLAVIDTVDGEVRGENLLELRPGWVWIAVLAPMPVFFATAGWANATATPRSAAPRLATLAGLGAVITGIWGAAVIVAVAATGEPGLVGDGARIATQPLWFVAAYAPMAAAGRRLASLAARRPAGVLVAVLGGLVVLDVGRFAADLPTWTGWAGFLPAWGLAWLAGGWWRDRAERGRIDERTAGLGLLVGAGGAAIALVHLAGYSPALIDAVPGARSNTTPPTVYTAVVGLAQVGALIAGAAALDRLGRRWRSAWDRAGAAAVAVYAWHLTALALCGAAVAAGVPVPARLSGTWWASRPLWFAAVLGVTAGLVAITAVTRTALRRRGVERSGPGTGGAVVGTVVTAVGAAVVGLEGPRSVGLAVAIVTLFALGWALLRGPAAHPSSR